MRKINCRKLFCHYYYYYKNKKNPIYKKTVQLQKEIYKYENAMRNMDNTLTKINLFNLCITSGVFLGVIIGNVLFRIHN